MLFIYLIVINYNFSFFTAISNSPSITNIIKFTTTIHDIVFADNPVLVTANTDIITSNIIIDINTTDLKLLAFIMFIYLI